MVELVIGEPIPDDKELNIAPSSMEHTERGLRLREPTPEQRVRAEAYRQFGVSPEDVQMGAPPLTRLMGGFRGDIPEERAAYLGQKYPEAEVNILDVEGQGRYPAYQLPGEPVTVFNPPGAEWGDTPQLVGEAAVPVAAATMRGLPGGPGGVTASNILAAGTSTPMRVAAGQYLRELFQAATGTGRETVAEAAPRIGIEAAAETLGPPVLGRPVASIGDLFRLRGYQRPGQQRQDLINVGELYEGAQMPLTLPQIYDSPTLQRLGAQSEAMSADYRRRLMSQRREAAEVAQEFAAATSEEVGKGIRRQAERRADRLTRTALRPYNTAMTPRKVGGAQAQAFDEFKTKSRQEVNEAYNVVDDWAMREQPTFDIGRLQNISRDERIMGMAVPEEVPGQIVDVSGRPMTTELVQEYINVSASPSGRVKRAADLLGRLDQTQTNYEVLKEIRTQVGKAIDVMPWQEDRNVGIGKHMYRLLTEAMMNPTTPAPNFVRSMQNAKNKALQRFDMMENVRVREQITGDQTPEELIGRFRDNPALWNEKVRRIYTDYDPRGYKDVRTYLKRDILQKDNPAEYLARIERDNPEFGQFLNPSRGEAEQFSRALRQLERLRSGRMYQALENVNRNVEIAKQLFADDLGEQELKTLVQQVSGAGRYGGELARGQNAGRELLKLAAWERIVEKGTRGSGLDKYLDLDAMSAAADWAEKSGIRRHLFNAKDRQRLDGLVSLARLTKKRAQDTGTSLEAAAAVANLKHPATFAQGLSALTAAKAAGWVMGNPKLNQMLFKAKVGNTKEPFSDMTVDRMGYVLGAIADYALDLEERVQ